MNKCDSRLLQRALVDLAGVDATIVLRADPRRIGLDVSISTRRQPEPVVRRFAATAKDVDIVGFIVQAARRRP